jgi:hypothetical protein
MAIEELRTTTPQHENAPQLQKAHQILLKTADAFHAPTCIQQEIAK